MVRIYGFKNCPYCSELKELYDKNGIEYQYVDVHNPKYKEHSEKIFEKAGSTSVPIIIVGSKMLVPEISFRTIPQALRQTKKFLDS